MHVVIRADGGPEIGYGHLVRSGALADELLERNVAVTYATTTPATAEEILSPEVSIVELPDRGNPEPFVEWLTDADVDVVYSDAYPVDTDYQRAVRELAPLVVFLDDARYPICADVFVNGNLYGPTLDYTVVGDEPEWCLGGNYALLREEIRSLAACEPPARARPQRAIVTMGGSDVANLTPTVVRSFDGFEIQVDIIVGPGFSNERPIRSAADEIDAETEVVRDPDNLPERLYRADFAVSACGSTIYELLALGTPIIGIPVVDNQTLIASSLQEHGLGTILRRKPDSEEVQSAVENVSTDTERRLHQQEVGRQVVDGRGVKRVAAELFSLAEGGV